jgi:Secretion system C-terminal sorting domain
MKFKLLLFLWIPIFLQAQTTISDSTTMGPGYANQVWYSMSKGTIKQEPKNNWDIGFEITKQSAGIIINNVTGVTLRVMPNATAANWSTAYDTTGLMNSPLLYNSDTSWSFGAFNQNRTGIFDYGWGKYNITTHIVSADSIFIIQVPGQKIKKIVIESLVDDKIYNIKYANLDGTEEVKFTADKSLYANKNYIYYSFANKALVDREPPKTDWDITFMQYFAYTQGLYYPVTGVMSNLNCPTLKVLSDTTMTGYKGKSFKSNISEIGFDWKTFNGMVFLISNTTGYYLNTANGLYKMTFTGFTGSSQGKSYFNKTLLSPVSTKNLVPTFEKVQIYPNPSNGDNLTIELKNLDKNGETTLYFHDMTGKLLKHNTYFGNNNDETINWSNLNLNAGIYLLTIKKNNYSTSHKVVIK